MVVMKPSVNNVPFAKTLPKESFFQKNVAKVTLLCQIDSVFLSLILEKCLSLHSQIAD